MKAIVQDRYGSIDALRFAEVEMPTCGPDEVLVAVHAASVHADVWHVVMGVPYVLRLMGSGLRKPSKVIPGTDMAGVVHAVGAEVRQFAPGDAVFGETVSGMQWVNGGAYAEYVAVPAAVLARKPENVSFEQAATVPTSGMIALMNLESAGMPKPGEQVLVNGAAGGVGSLALQIAKAQGASVTAVDAAEKLDMLRELGADRVIDYQQEDFTRGDQRFDLIFDVASNLRLGDCQRVLTDSGKYVVIGHDHYGTQGRAVLGSIPKMFALMARAPFSKHLPKSDFAGPDKPRLMAALRELLAQGKLTPLVGRTLPLPEVCHALQALVSGQTRGRIVVVPRLAS